MPRFAANISFLFSELDLPERIDAAAEAGFEAVEILFPYDTPVPALRRRLEATGLPLALINAPPPNYTGGTPGFAALPGGEERFRHDFARVLRYAGALGPRHIHIMAGAAEGPEARAAFLRNLAWAAAEAPAQSLTIEPINPVDMPGYFLADFDLAAEIITEVGAPNLGLQFDAYHAHRITGDVLGTWERHRALVRHVQIADHPGRHEPGSGEIDFPAFFARLDADGYEGFVSAEYHPAGSTAEGLGWLGKLAAR
ncbi:hydroxypyruvate isomerase [Meinhardsimonia xiamenensis]|jgi:hydroxypyruvate isomerase|uniref:Hydroxypyruvate isomerase n=1 Tax=Meinhardsimonia xiamenensis TaxID=990712 RepID=A0A1G8Y0P5_9RHOB|nr:TIM barrel protein [Meinhardsimonia xiamenensis]PRX37120.1 hydroxypyruvate isomerase [Meinhardsimonia xiamenensis]SDJ96297.1 hydroxypyruvate isomerase [Meinhardsimonia xiamenensis]